MPIRIKRTNLKNKIYKRNSKKQIKQKKQKKQKKQNKQKKQTNQTNQTNEKKQNYKKKSIPKAVREQVWVTYFGKCFEHKCYISWCKNIVNVYDFHIGHDTPESKGGTLEINNLKPICSRCNTSMSNNYTIKEWNNTYKKKFKCCFF